MTLKEILDAIDQLSPDDMAQVKVHLLLDERQHGSQPTSTDLVSMAGLFQATVDDLSVNARDYFHNIMQAKNHRPN